MSSITKQQMKSLMKEIKTGEAKKYWDVKRRQIQKKATWYKKTKSREWWGYLWFYGLDKEGQNMAYYDVEINKKTKKIRIYYEWSDWNKKCWFKRQAEIAKYEAMNALWQGTPLCEDVMGEILSYL